MAGLRRRKTTLEEVAQGQEEMRLAEARFQKEAVERGEKALEDKPEGNTSEDAEGKMSPLQEDKRMIVQKEPQPKVPIRVLPASLCSPRLIRHLTLLRWAKTTLPTAPMTRR